MNTPRIIAWINCYGAWDPQHRHPLETLGYDQYLDGVVQRLRPLADRVTAIYLSGGMLDAEGKSECETTEPELAKRLAAVGISVPIHPDEESLTTTTIVRTFLKTAREQYPQETPLLFVDDARYDMNLFLLGYFGVSEARSIVVPLPRVDSSPQSTRESQTTKINRMREEGVEKIEEEQAAERRRGNEAIKKTLRA